MEEEVNNQNQKIEVEKPTQKGVFINSKWIKLGGLLVLILILLGGAYYLGTQKTTNTQPSNTPTPTISQVLEEKSETPTQEPTKAVESKSFTSPKFSELGFSGYSLTFPADWTLKEERDNSVPVSTVTLTKQGYTLKIFQAATGGAQCIYEGDMPEGPASDYRTNKYSDLITGFATLRQTENPSSGKMAYSYCQKNTSDGSFGQPTSVGHMNLTTGVAVLDPKIVSEFEGIIKSIKTL